MKKFWIILATVVLFVASFIYFAVADAPAQKILAMINLPREISLYGVDGTVLNGKAKTLKVQQYEYRNVRWRTSLLGLLGKSVELSISDPQGITGRGSVSYDGSNTLSLSDIFLHLSVANLLKYTKYQMPVDIAGATTLKIKNADFTAKKCIKINGVAELNDIVIMTALGDYSLGRMTLDLNCRNGLFTAKTNHANPYFTLDGNLEYDMNTRKYSIKAFAKPDVENGAEVKILLDMLGKPNLTGAYEINYQGTFVY